MAYDRTPYKPDVDPSQNVSQIEPNRIGGFSYLDYSSYHRMCDFLRINDVDRREPKVAEKVSNIADWAQSISGSKRELDHMKEIKKLIHTLGESHVGIDLIDRLNRYTQLDEKKREVEEEMTLYQEETEEEEKIKLPPSDRKTKEKMKERLAQKIEKDLRTKVKREVRKELKTKEEQRKEEETGRNETNQFLEGFM